MERSAGADSDEERNESRSERVGPLPLSDERLGILAPQWEAIYRSLRTMDRIPLGETEPATLFVWEEEER